MTTDAMATASTSWLRPLRWFEPSVNTAPGAEQVTAGRFSLPVGTVTFLLTDVEGSTRAWEATPEAMGEAIARHYAILDAAVSSHGGVRPQEQGEGDSIVAAFGRASDALRAAADAQRGLAEEAERVQPVGLASPLRVRMAVHTGEAQMRDEANYVGQAIIRTARLRAIAHGGQVLVSQAVRDLVVDQLGDRVELLDLGVHRLKDLARPEHVWQLAGSGMEREFPPLKSLDALPNNLPIELSTFIGRHAEIEELCGLLATNRVVTVTGAGGSGKTRLAQQVAAQLSDGYPDGTWWVELAPVGTDAVRGMIAAAVSVVEPDRLVERLAGRMLLVLDNCEHVLAVVAALVQQIVAKCPEVSVLATSRGPLDVPGERTWRVPPLPAPVVGERVPIEGLRQFDAVRLFVDRAQRARPNFALTTANGPAVAELCARLDGIPLAIELAAARVKSLTPEQILGGLEDALRLLTGGSRLVLPRQQTLEASIGWSHDLLAERDRTLFRRLAVFAEGWDLDAAEAVCTDADEGGPAHVRGSVVAVATSTTGPLTGHDDDGQQPRNFRFPALGVHAVLDGLERLIDQSLIRVDERDGVARYALLETVRQFAARQLEAHVDERDALRTRHASWFAGLAGAIGPLVEGPDEHACVARLSPERNNLSVALHHLLDTGNPGALAEMTLACGPFWNSADTPAEGRNWTTTALDGVIDEPLRVRLLGARAMHVFLIGNMYEVLSEARAVLVPAEAIGDRRTAGRARALEACAARFTDVDQAVDQFDRAAEDCRTAGDRFGEAHALCQKASLCAFRGLRRTAQELATAGGVVAALANPSLCAWHNDSLATLSLRTADHAGMRAALQPLGAREVHAMPLRCALDLMIRADHGDELPDPDPIAARVLVLERAENFRDAMMLNMALMQLLRLADASERGQAVADDAARRMPILPRWHLDGALFALALGDPEGARERLARAVPLPGDVELRLFIAASMISALIARHDRDFTKAEAAAHVALSLAVEHEHARETLDALEVLAGIAAAHGSWQLTARLAGAAQERRDCHPLKARTEPIRSMLTADLTVSRNALGEPAFQKAFDEGRLLSGDDAVAYAQRARGERSRPTIGWASLTPTERRVVDLARHGLTNGDIAAELLMGAETVKTHLSRTYAKLAVANRTQLAALPRPNDTSTASTTATTEPS